MSLTVCVKAARYGSSGGVPRLWTYSRDYDSFSSQKACYMFFYVCSSDIDCFISRTDLNYGSGTVDFYYLLVLEVAI